MPRFAGLPYVAAFALLLGACAGDESGAGEDQTSDTGGRPDLPTTIDTGQPDTGADGTMDAEPDGLDSEWTPGELELRTREEVCGRWVADRSLRQPRAWSSGGGGDCDAGTLDPVAIEDAVRYTNLYRWLTGLPGIVDSDDLNEKTQACALIMRGLNDIMHEVPSSADCFTDDGSEAALSSNLALGPRHPAPAVDLYMVDDGVPSLGHRRWIMNPSYSEGGFGLVDRFSCQWVFTFGGTGSAQFMAFPNAGVAPVPEYVTWWSFSSGAVVEFDLSTRIDVYDVETGEQLVVEQYVADRGFGPDTIAFRPEGWSFDRTYEVRVVDALENGSREDVIYRTTPSLCQELEL